MTHDTPPPEPGKRTTYGPQTWAMIREAYLAGTPAPHLSRTFGPNQHTIRKRAVREGWTRLAQALAQEPALLAAAGARDRSVASTPAEADPLDPAPSTPRAAVNQALMRAAILLVRGHPTDAAATLKAAETLHRLTEDVAAAHARAAARDEAAEDEFAAWIELRAAALAQAVLDGETDAVRPAHAAWAHRWWEEHGHAVEEPA